MNIIIVNDQDEAIGVKERESLSPDDIYRASAVWITNSQKEMLMAQRSLQKKLSPGQWGPAAAGTLEEGETYESNIIKEIGEELGLQLSIADLQKGPKVRIKGSTHYFFCQWYLYTIDKPAEEFVIQKEEVEQVKWFKKEELFASLEGIQKSFLDSIRQWIDLFC
jgi:isopentenyldiphosphate isomerase